MFLPPVFVAMHAEAGVRCTLATFFLHLLRPHCRSVNVDAIHFSDPTEACTSSKLWVIWRFYRDSDNDSCDSCGYDRYSLFLTARFAFVIVYSSKKSIITTELISDTYRWLIRLVVYEMVNIKASAACDVQRLCRSCLSDTSGKLIPLHKPYKKIAKAKTELVDSHETIGKLMMKCANVRVCCNHVKLHKFICQISR